jgi:hypothetical protein
MITWADSNIVFGVGELTGAIVLFLVTFDFKGRPRYTPVARTLPVFARPADA